MLEDRNAPGSVLGELVAAARGELAPSPLDQVGWLLGPGLLPPAAEARSAVISVRAAEPRTPAPPPAAPLLQPPGENAERSDPRYNGGQANSSVGVGLPVDDDPFFLPVAAVARAAQLAARAAGMADPNAAGGGGGGAAIAGPASAGVTVSAASPTGSGQPAPAAATFFVLQGNMSPAKPTAATPAHPTPAAPATPGVSPADNSLSRTTVTAAYETDFPNTAPVANDDTVTVDEDGSVVIDVLANDTDDDGDPLQIDSWDYQPAHGTVTQTDDGKLQYTPDADYDDRPYGMGDTFTYTATDGQDVSNTATVTVHFNPVNDPPVAFNDMFAFVNDVADGDPYWDPAWGPYPYMPAGSGSVLANDFDLEDGSPGQVAYTDFTGTVGTVNMNPDGSFFYEGPWDFVGDTSFQYQAVDSSGALSDWVTVKLRVTDPNAGSTTVTANPDTMVVGEDPTTFNVLANDSGGSVAVLTAPPGVGITAFDFDGTAHYAPRADGVPIGGQLSYNLFASAGAGSAFATADVEPVRMDIYNGQGAQTAVAVKARETVGAFTVVNKNDTDGDAKVDNVDTAGVRAVDGVGTDEKDLMQLRVYKPAGYVEGEAATVTVTHGAGRLFLSPNRLGDGAPALLVDTFIDSGTKQPVDYRDFRAEVYDTSNVLRDISIQMKYKDQTDTVKATGIWVTFDNATGFHAGGGTGPSNDADGKAYKVTFNSLAELAGFKLGQPPMLKSDKDPQTGLPGFTVMLVNTMEAEFTVLPAGVNNEQGRGIRFDVRRSIQVRAWLQAAGAAHATPAGSVDFLAFRESANDNAVKNLDNDNEPTKNNHIYSLDFPGWKLSIAADAAAAGDYSKGTVRRIYHMNAQEFVSVAVNGETEASSRGNGVWGSRASELIDWRAWSDFQWNGTAWVRTENTADTVYNEMTLGDPRDVNTPAPP